MNRYGRKELALIAAFAIYNLAIITLAVLFLVKVYNAYQKYDWVLLPLVAGFAGGVTAALVLIISSKKIIFAPR